MIKKVKKGAKSVTRKLGIAILILIVIILIASLIIKKYEISSNGWTHIYLNEPDGFLSMKWGESIQVLKDKGIYLESLGRDFPEHVGATGKHNSIGNIPLDKTCYWFYRDKLYAIVGNTHSCVIDLNRPRYFDILKNVLINRYGKPRISEKENGIRVIGWRIGDVGIALEEDLYKGVSDETSWWTCRTKITYVYGPTMYFVSKVLEKFEQKERNRIKDEIKGDL